MLERTHELRTPSAHVIVFTPLEGARRWVREELVDAECVVENASSIAALVERLSTQPGSPTMGIVDFDGSTDADRAHLRATRAAWKGVLIALGAFPSELRDVLRVRYQIGRPLGSEALRKVVDDVIARRGRRIIGPPIELGTLVQVPATTLDQLR